MIETAKKVILNGEGDSWFERNLDSTKTIRVATGCRLLEEFLVNAKFEGGGEFLR